jgi:hypothetical protein
MVENKSRMSTELLRKQLQLNTRIKSLPKWEIWANIYKRHVAEYKKEMTKHTQSLKAYVKEAKDDTKDAKAQKYDLERPTMRCKRTKSVSKVAISTEKKESTLKERNEA